MHCWFADAPRQGLHRASEARSRQIGWPEQAGWDRNDGDHPPQFGQGEGALPVWITDCQLRIHDFHSLRAEGNVAVPAARVAREEAEGSEPYPSRWKIEEGKRPQHPRFRGRYASH